MLAVHVLHTLLHHDMGHMFLENPIDFYTSYDSNIITEQFFFLLASCLLSLTA